jgi:uncharacterized protein YjbJ (UPF0337 family)
MNEDTFAGQWKQMRGALKSWWGKLSDDDFEFIGGQKDKLIGLLQEKYGQTRDQAQSEVEQRFNEYRASNSMGVSDIKAKAYEFGENAADKARGAVSAAAEGFEKASSYVQDNDFKTMASDLTAFVRKYPVQSFLVGAGLFYFLLRHRET